MSTTEEPKFTKSGGPLFFLSLIVMFCLSITWCAALPAAYNPETSKRPLTLFLIAAAVGILVSRAILVYFISVFIHESKHMVASLIAGNKIKGMQVGMQEGHLEYEYTKDTAGYNAFIALAPYIMPLFTLIGFILGICFPSEGNTRLLLMLGLGVGIDFIMNTRDIGPHQTDFQSIRGGFPVGLVYVLSVNVLILAAVLTWVLGGFDGFEKVYVLLIKWFLGKEVSLDFNSN